MPGITADKWAKALARAQATVAQMTVEEKVSQNGHYSMATSLIALFQANMTRNAGNAGCSGNLFGTRRRSSHRQC